MTTDAATVNLEEFGGIDPSRWERRIIDVGNDHHPGERKLVDAIFRDSITSQDYLVYRATVLIQDALAEGRITDEGARAILQAAKVAGIDVRDL